MKEPMSNITNKSIAKMLRDLADSMENGSNPIAFSLSWARTDEDRISHSHIVINRAASPIIRTILRGEVQNAIRTMNVIEDRYERMSKDAPKSATLN
jgi:hypothetical protein